MAIDTRDISLKWEKLTRRSPQQRKVYLFLVECGESLGPKEISERLATVSYDYIKTAVLTLEKKGLLENDGDGNYRALKHAKPSQEKPHQDILENTHTSSSQKSGQEGGGLALLESDSSKDITTLFKEWVDSTVDPEALMIELSKKGVYEMRVTDMLKMMDKESVKIELVARFIRLGDVGTTPDAEDSAKKEPPTTK